jgi:hypothetical protein
VHLIQTEKKTELEGLGLMEYVIFATTATYRCMFVCEPADSSIQKVRYRVVDSGCDLQFVIFAYYMEFRQY